MKKSINIVLTVICILIAFFQSGEKILLGNYLLLITMASYIAINWHEKKRVLKSLFSGMIKIKGEALIVIFPLFFMILDFTKMNEINHAIIITLLLSFFLAIFSFGLRIKEK